MSGAQTGLIGHCRPYKYSVRVFQGFANFLQVKDADLVVLSKVCELLRPFHRLSGLHICTLLTTFGSIVGKTLKLLGQKSLQAKVIGVLFRTQFFRGGALHHEID